MNLQLCSPYKKCPFNCPMCIAATDDGEVNNVFNLFEAEPFEYMKKRILISIVFIFSTEILIYCRYHKIIPIKSFFREKISFIIMIYM